MGLTEAQYKIDLTENVELEMRIIIPLLYDKWL